MGTKLTHMYPCNREKQREFWDRQILKMTEKGYVDVQREEE